MNKELLHFYASVLGWSLFPCSSKNKKPLTPHGFKDATTDLKQLEAWYQQYPDCAWGTPTSAERGILDIDRHPDKPDGFKTLEALEALEAQHGPLAATPKV